MNGDGEPYQSITGIEWPPPLANRATRRHCQHRAKGNDRDGYYCVDCGTMTRPALSEGETPQPSDSRAGS